MLDLVVADPPDLAVLNRPWPPGRSGWEVGFIDRYRGLGSLYGTFTCDCD